MSLENKINADGSIVVNVIPSIGKIIPVDPTQKQQIMNAVEQARRKYGARQQRPADFDPTRYVSFSGREVIEDPVEQEFIHEYVQKSRLANKLGF